MGIAGHCARKSSGSGSSAKLSSTAHSPHVTAQRRCIAKCPKPELQWRIASAQVCPGLSFA